MIARLRYSLSIWAALRRRRAERRAPSEPHVRGHATRRAVAVETVLAMRQSLGL